MDILDVIIKAVRSALFEEHTTMVPQEVIIKDIDKNGTIVAKHTSAPSEVLDTVLGSITGGQFGYFTKPMPGTKVIAVRVYPGSTNHTQIIKTISNPAQQEHDGISNPVSDTEQGVMNDGNYEINPGDILLRSISNQKISMTSFKGQDGSIEILENNGNGISIETLGASTLMNFVSHYSQHISAASRAFSGEYHHKVNEINYKKTSSDMYAVVRPETDSDKKVGLFFHKKAYDSEIMKSPRNVPLTFYKKIINQITEKAKFIGFENERQILDLKDNPETAYDAIENGRYNESRGLYNLFYMAPDQLLQVISGNLLSEANNYSPININYGVTLFDDFKTSKDAYQAKEENNLSFIRIKNNFKRGIGYHFQLNTHDNIKDDFISSKNTRVILDKEGILKVNISKSSKNGNIMYVDNTKFMKDFDTTSSITNGFAQESRPEGIPITLRGKEGEVILPSLTSTEYTLMTARRQGKKRNSGIEFLNSNGYFGNTNSDNLKIRVNTTKHHNMWAACEMLLANYITQINPPPSVGSILSDIARIDMATIVPFEQGNPKFAGSLVNASKKEFQQEAYGTVLVSPQDPIINPGGDTIFAGRVFTDLNSYSTDDLNQDGESKSYSGVSANLNLEGSLEVSIGADDADKKSLTLDTQGGAVMWFGKDDKNRSLSVQTDGHAMFNIGGHSGDGTFTAGRLDLRVNLTDKGTIERQDVGDGVPEINSDFIISISDKGIVISGMKENIPMLINNSGQITLQSKSGILLNGGMGGVKVLEKNRNIKDVGVPQSTTANSYVTGETANAESVATLFKEVGELSGKLA